MKDFGGGNLDSWVPSRIILEPDMDHEVDAVPSCADARLVYQWPLSSNPASPRSAASLQEQLSTTFDDWLQRQSVKMESHLAQQTHLLSKLIMETRNRPAQCNCDSGQYDSVNRECYGDDCQYPPSNSSPGVCHEDDVHVVIDEQDSAGPQMTGMKTTVADAIESIALRRRFAKEGKLDDGTKLNRGSKAVSLSVAESPDGSHADGSHADKYYVMVPKFLKRKSHETTEQEKVASQRTGQVWDVNYMKSSTAMSRRLAVKGPLSWMSFQIYCLVKSPWFDKFFGVFVVASVVSLGAEIEYMSNNEGRSTELFYQLTQTFNCVFGLELILRLTGEQREFFAPENRAKNSMDFAFVMFSFFEFVLMASDLYDPRESRSNSGRLIRMTRLLRVARPARLLRVASRAREFQKMVNALQDCTTTLLWTLLVLLVTSFGFAVVFTQASTEFLRCQNAENACNATVELSQFEDLEIQQRVILLIKFFGHLPRSLKSLYMSIAGGVDWEILVRSLQLLHPGYEVLFYFFHFLSVFGVINVVTSVFVDSVMRSSQHSKELLMQEEESKRDNIISHIKNIFDQLDADGDGAVSIQEMTMYLANQELRNYLDAIGLNCDEYKLLFKLLDVDDCGFVNFNEFCDGLFRLKGEAKSFDMHCVMFEQERFFRKWSNFVRSVDNRLDVLADGIELCRHPAAHSNHPAAPPQMMQRNGKINGHATNGYHKSRETKPEMSEESEDSMYDGRFAK